MSGLSLKNICKTYKGGQEAVRKFNLEIKDKEFLILVGPSGCGKSTLLRMIAGLEDITSGELWIGDRLVNEFEPRKRGLSMVFQNYALYPHMTVYKNMAYGLKVNRVPKEEIDKRVREAAKILEIDNLLDRKPGQLSGGQRQRVAIGSAIVRKPEAFLMDEPLSNLDAKLRTQMRVELARLHKELKTTIIYVTHDQVEAMTLGTRIVVMRDGKIQQVDAPDDLYQNPINKFVAGFIGSPAMNFITAWVECRGREVFLEFANQSLALNETCSNKLIEGGYAGERVILGIRPENFHETGDKRYKVSADIEVIEMLGAEVLIHGKIGKEHFSAKMPPACKLKTGEKVSLYVDIDKIKIFDSVSEVNILYV